MMFDTQSDKDRAGKKVEIAIDKMIDLQDMGAGCDTVSRVLDSLNSLQTTISMAGVRGRKFSKTF